MGDAADTEPLKGQATESARSSVPPNNGMLFKRHMITDFKTRCFPVTKRKMAGRKLPQNSNLNKFICRRKTLNIRSSLTHNDPTTVTTCSGRTPTRLQESPRGAAAGHLSKLTKPSNFYTLYNDRDAVIKIQYQILTAL